MATTVSSAAPQPADINSMAPQPTAEVHPSVAHEIEKRFSHDQEMQDLHDDEKPEISDEESNKQDGVKRVEAITAVWSKQMLIVMFVL